MASYSKPAFSLPPPQQPHVMNSTPQARQYYHPHTYLPYEPSVPSEAPGEQAQQHETAMDQMYLDLRIQYAMLEKDLEHCLKEKAEAEIAVQYLAQLNSTTALKFNGGTSAEEVLALKRELTQTKTKYKDLKSKLDAALTALLVLANDQNTTTGPNKSSLHRGHATSQSKKGAERGVGADPSSHIGSSEENTTLLEDTDEESLEYDSTAEEPKAIEHTPSSSFSSDPSAVSYIERFKKGSKKDSKSSEPGRPDQSSSPNPLSSESRPFQSVVKAGLESMDDEISTVKLPNSVSEAFHSDFPKVSLEPLPEQIESNIGISANITQSLVVDGKTVWPPLTTNANPHPMHNLETFRANLEQYHQPPPDSQPIAKKVDAPKVRQFTLDPEHQEAYANHRRRIGSSGLLTPDFYRYGIRYTPDKEMEDTYRTILMTGLQQTATISDVLNKVRGGLIVDAKLLNTTALQYSKTALVTFLHSSSATSYHTFTDKHKIIIKNTIPQVTLVRTPTYPVPINILKAITAHKKTRCFALHNFPSNISAATVRQDLCFKDMTVNGLESARVIDKGVLELRFTSIRHACQAEHLLTSCGRYKGCVLKTLPDPCEGPLEECAGGLEKDEFTVADEDFTVSKLLGLEGSSADDSAGRLSTSEETSEEAEHRKGRGFEGETPIENFGIRSTFTAIKDAASSVCTLS